MEIEQHTKFGGCSTSEVGNVLWVTLHNSIDLLSFCLFETLLKPMVQQVTNRYMQQTITSKFLDYYGKLTGNILGGHSEQLVWRYDFQSSLLPLTQHRIHTWRKNLLHCISHAFLTISILQQFQTTGNCTTLVLYYEDVLEAHGGQMILLCSALLRCCLFLFCFTLLLCSVLCCTVLYRTFFSSILLCSALCCVVLSWADLLPVKPHKEYFFKLRDSNQTIFLPRLLLRTLENALQSF